MVRTFFFTQRAVARFLTLSFFVACFLPCSSWAFEKMHQYMVVAYDTHDNAWKFLVKELYTDDQTISRSEKGPPYYDIFIDDPQQSFKWMGVKLHSRVLSCEGGYRLHILVSQEDLSADSPIRARNLFYKLNTQERLQSGGAYNFHWLSVAHLRQLSDPANFSFRRPEPSFAFEFYDKKAKERVKGYIGHHLKNTLRNCHEATNVADEIEQFGNKVRGGKPPQHKRDPQQHVRKQRGQQQRRPAKEKRFGSDRLHRKLEELGGALQAIT